MACAGCERRRKHLKKYLKTVFKVNDGVHVPEKTGISNQFVKKMNAKYGKKHQ